MKVLHIDEQRGWRGGEQQAAYLIESLIDQGHDVYLAGRPGAPFLERPHAKRAAACWALPFRGEADLYTAWRLGRLAARDGIDVLHAHTSHAHTMACLARKAAGRGIVVVSRRVDFAPRPNAFTRWKYAAADHVVAISNRIGDVLRTYGVPEAKLSVIHSGIDPARFDVEPAARASLGVPEGVPLLGNVAALVGHKDHATLLAAVPRVLEALPELRLLIAGEGPLRGELEAQIKALGIGHAVALLGYRTDVPQLMRAFDAFVLSSKEEGLGTSVLDAMACGKPIAATGGGGIPEMVQHEKTGLLAPVQEPEALGAAIIRLFNEPALAQRLARNGLRLLDQRFTAARMAQANLALYERLLSGARLGSSTR